jgi:hypothetical protein
MFKKFFDATAVDAFATRLVDELKRLRPPERLESDTKGAKRQQEVFDAFLQHQVKALATTAKLNFYQKVRLGTRLEDLLEAAGYPRAFGHELSRDVVHTVAMSSLPEK